MELIYERLANLLSEKSIITNAVLLLIAFSVVKGMISGDQILNSFNLIIGFYFGTQIEKRVGGKL